MRRPLVRLMDRCWPATVLGVPLMGWRWTLFGALLALLPGAHGAGLTVVAIVWGLRERRRLARRDQAHYWGTHPEAV